MGGIGGALVFLFFDFLIKVPHAPLIYLAYGLSALVAVLVSEAVKRDMMPMEGIIKSSSAVLFIIVTASMALYLNLEGSLESHIMKNAEVVSQELLKNKDKIAIESALEKQQYLDFWTNPQLVTKSAMDSLPRIPGLFFGMIFFFVWLTFYLVLRTNKLYGLKGDYIYSENSLLDFRVAEFWVWPVMASLTLFLLGKETVGEWPLIIAENTLFILGTFYFFQGFGVYTRFLDLLGIRGFLRSFLVVFTLLSGYHIVAFVGLLDNWLDFRTRMNKKLEKE